MTKRVSLLLVALMLLAAVVTPVFAEGGPEQAYPSKSAEFLIPFGAGGSADVLGRAMANAAEKYYGQSIVPVNKVGGGGGVMYQEMVNSGDEYTLGWSSSSILTVTNIGNVPFGYDAIDNICRIGYTSVPIAVLADSPWQTLEQFVAYAKANPGELVVGNAGTGSLTHLTSIVIGTATGIDVVHIPIGAERRLPALLGGEIQAVVAPLPEISPLVDSGDIRILAFPSGSRDKVYSDVPTMQELGYDVVLDLFRSISVPSGTSAEVEDFIEDVFRQATEDPAFKDLATKQGFIIDFMGREDFQEYLAVQDVLIANAMDVGGLR
jgi:tripartite-type tricarboxylate transporter receptor subunit TctC